MATQDGKCGFDLGGGRKCNNRVRQGASACYMHEAQIQQGVEFEAVDAEIMHDLLVEMSPELRNPIPSYSFNNMRGDTSADLLKEEVSYGDTSLLLAIMQAAENVRDVTDPTIPSVAIKYGESILQKMTEEMVNLGIDRNRVTRIRTVGASIRGFTHIAIEEERLSHEELIIDEGKDHEFVVAPCIAALAPVFDLDVPVSQQMPVGSPFTDYPWIASFDHYMQDGYINWMRDRGDLTDEEARELEIIEQMDSDPDFANSEIVYGDEDIIMTPDDDEPELIPMTVEEVVSNAVLPSEYLDNATPDDDEAYIKKIVSEYESTLSASGFSAASSPNEDDDPFGDLAR